MGQGKPATQEPNGLEISTNGSRNDSNRTVAIGRKAESYDDSRNHDTWQHLSRRKTLITASFLFFSSFSYLLIRTTTHKSLATFVLLLVP
ncbi:hypothetical protein PanWU01x14_234620 [Parasponia andersonii]|uniref:Transmembrane protein n=1 Tax=Parasponia andersonii TaxID=3476 RepID=A0A2P5BIZ5_PARAD|nr:hypothetical protein PanWU01x14_234620 [Parasponia andersonii]